MRAQVRQALAAIEAVEDPEARGDLWDILTALRGPDSDDHNLKWDTTAIIRAATLPSLANNSGADVNNDDTIAALHARIGNDSAVAMSRGHFDHHIFYAVKAIMQQDAPAFPDCTRCAELAAQGATERNEFGHLFIAYDYTTEHEEAE